jgi:hypothetical protein
MMRKIYGQENREKRNLSCGQESSRGLHLEGTTKLRFRPSGGGQESSRGTSPLELTKLKTWGENLSLSFSKTCPAPANHFRHPENA